MNDGPRDFKIDLPTVIANTPGAWPHLRPSDLTCTT